MSPSRLPARIRTARSRPMAVIAARALAARCRMATADPLQRSRPGVGSSEVIPPAQVVGSRRLSKP
jgi:hypothetical protein